MNKRILFQYTFVFGLLLISGIAYAQQGSVTDDFNVEGPWTDLERTSITAPKVPDGAVSIDGIVSSGESGGFDGVHVTPLENVWILSFPDDRVTDGPEDTSFTFYVAHDNNNLYIGVQAQDDVINSDDPNSAFWKDDAIELIFDYRNAKLDQNFDSQSPAFGGHPYVNWEGRFSDWDDENDTFNDRNTFTLGKPDDEGNVDLENKPWSYGEDGDIYGSGIEVDGGWSMEVRFSKASLADPESDIELDNGHTMDFNIGMDDDDQQGPGPNGDGSRTQDLELQYFWSNRTYAEGWTLEEYETNAQGFFTDEQMENRAWLDPEETLFDLVINNEGRLKPGGAGDLTFSGTVTDVPDWSIF